MAQHQIDHSVASSWLPWSLGSVLHLEVDRRNAAHLWFYRKVVLSSCQNLRQRLRPYLFSLALTCSHKSDGGIPEAGRKYVCAISSRKMKWMGTDLCTKFHRLSYSLMFGPWRHKSPHSWKVQLRWTCFALEFCCKHSKRFFIPIITVRHNVASLM